MPSDRPLARPEPLGDIIPTDVGGDMGGGTRKKGVMREHNLVPLVSSHLSFPNALRRPHFDEFVENELENRNIIQNK